MARVTGIGGFFFRALDPEALNSVFAAVAPDSNALGPAARTWKINFRVNDLDGIVERLRSTGVAVEPHEQSYPNGRFAELEDPEGNQIQLWEPNPASIARDTGLAP